MRSYWVHFRKPLSLLKVIQMHEERNETVNRNRGLIKSIFKSFYLSNTFIVEMLILLIQPWPGTEKVLIVWE